MLSGSQCSNIIIRSGNLSPDEKNFIISIITCIQQQTHHEIHTVHSDRYGKKEKKYVTFSFSFLFWYQIYFVFSVILRYGKTVYMKNYNSLIYTI